ncbi:LOW QUALITY PROTEIN: uncharacterized protein LOC129782675 [Falco peregrinus]|uniref:LOW QUALITY PROTEIN: uncharacterized protein LOC129782675 n=1 Tax=Falco peregrinus TaxID=8954 RepID=UPI002478E64F|nr:LOW QUALITY PROTEIN: uncharacterized protein LOC129782675 [Falco peregrinus]
MHPPPHAGIPRPTPASPARRPQHCSGGQSVASRWQQHAALRKRGAGGGGGVREEPGRAGAGVPECHSAGAPPVPTRVALGKTQLVAPAPNPEGSGWAEGCTGGCGGAAPPAPPSSRLPPTLGRRCAPLSPDLCSGDVPEVEIISLLGEPLPRYTLRADTLFGYDHEDWLRAPPRPPEPVAPLTPQQIEETLRYFRECPVRGGGAGEGSGHRQDWWHWAGAAQELILLMGLMGWISLARTSRANSGSSFCWAESDARRQPPLSPGTPALCRASLGWDTGRGTGAGDPHGHCPTKPGVAEVGTEPLLPAKPPERWGVGAWGETLTAPMVAGGDALW